MRSSCNCFLCEEYWVNLPFRLCFSGPPFAGRKCNWWISWSKLGKWIFRTWGLFHAACCIIVPSARPPFKASHVPGEVLNSFYFMLNGMMQQIGFSYKPFEQIVSSLLYVKFLIECQSFCSFYQSFVFYLALSVLISHSGCNDGMLMLCPFMLICFFLVKGAPYIGRWHVFGLKLHFNTWLWGRKQEWKVVAGTAATSAIWCAWGA